MMYVSPAGSALAVAKFRGGVLSVSVSVHNEAV
jgi:hypothetical protein